MTVVHQPGYYLIRKPGEPFVCEWADSPKDASRKVFGVVLQAKAGEWKYLGDKSLVTLGGPEREAAEGPEGWSRMDNRGTYKRDGEVRPERRSTPRPETPPGYSDTPPVTADAVAAEADLIFAAFQRGLDKIEAWAAKFDRLGMVNMARKVRKMGTELEAEVLGADVPMETVK